MARHHQPGEEEEVNNMDARKICIRCGGRMFLEFDYDTQRYDYVCIACGRLEPAAVPGPAQPDSRAIAPKNPGIRKTRDLLKA
jgi:hypothetical protein